MIKRFFSKKSTVTSFSTYAGVILTYILLQFAIAGDLLSFTLQGLLIQVCAYIVLALSLNLTVGVLGELSLGHAGFMCIGAFSGVVAASLLKDAVPNEVLRLFIGILIGALFAAVGGFLVGVPVLRLRGDYLAIVTLAFGEIIKVILTNLNIGYNDTGVHVSFIEPLTMQGGKTILKGAQGISGNTTISTLFAGFILILVTLIIIFNLINSRTGRAVMALRDNNIAAESVGINVTKYKLMTFVISAALAGAAGALFGLDQPAFDTSKFSFTTSIDILVYVVLGGLGCMHGSIIATVILYIVPETILRPLSEYRMLMYAIVLIVMMLATNNATIKNFLGRIGDAIKAFFAKIFKRKGAEKE